MGSRQNPKKNSMSTQYPVGEVHSTDFSEQGKDKSPPSKKIIFCSVKEVEAKEIVTKWVLEWRDEISALIFKDELYVLSTICPHFGGEFNYSSKKGVLRCKWHNFEYDVTSGKLLIYNLSTCLRHYPFEVNSNGDLEVFYRGSL